jgi:hypothetical protein
MASEMDNVAGLDLDPIVREAYEFFDIVSSYESDFRSRFLDDVRFSEGDADNGYQWPSAIKKNRDVDKRPCLTFNLTRQHNLQIINDLRQNKSVIKIRPTGGEATVQSAKVFEMWIRQIQYESDAVSAYLTGADFQVKGGIGWWRLDTHFIDDDTFDQAPGILRVKDPLSVFIDPNCEREDKSDAKKALVFVLMTEEEFEDEYPEYVQFMGTQPLGVGVSDDDTIKRKGLVRVCEYFRKVKTHDELVSFIDPQDGLRKELRKSKMPEDVYQELKKTPLTKRRAVAAEQIEWYLIAGDHIIERTIWPGDFIPLICAVGEESIIDGDLDRKGHTRAMKDPQRMLNYNASAQVEFVALQSKTPYIIAAKAIENYENMWNTANMVNHSALVYNDVDEEYPERQVPVPQRQQPPVSSPAFQEGMDTAFNQMMMTSGQWQNQMGMMGNERTGAAIRERQDQGYTSVYHFKYRYEIALKNTGRQLIDLIQKVCDTKRTQQMLDDQGQTIAVEIDPASPQAYFEELNARGEVVRRVLNPRIGKYAVQSDVGADYGTRRRETVDALTLILTQAPALTNVVGDLLLKNMDFNDADEAALRLRRMVPPQALGTGPSATEQQLQMQLTASQQALTKFIEKYAKDQLKLAGKDQMRDIDVYRAHTERVAALAKLLPEDPKVLEDLLQELDDEIFGETIKPIVEANRKGLEEQAGEGE